MIGPDMRKDQGAALVIVLAMLSVLSMIAVVTVESSLMGVRRTQNISVMTQARWYAMGAEAFAAARIQELRARQQSELVDQSDWQGRPFVFPLDDGAMTVSIHDGSNCFNLNSLVGIDENGLMAANTLAQFHFARLLDLVDVRSERTAWLVAALTDWIDPDDIAGAGGAEDNVYAVAETPYRVANAPLGDVGELASVRGFTPEAIAALAPYVCARAASTPNLLNPNTLRPEQAVLLSMAIGPELSKTEAETLVRGRPRGGWRDVDAFFAEPALTRIEVSAAARSAFSLVSDDYLVHTVVRHEDVTESVVSLIDAAQGGKVVRRVLGVGDRLLWL